MQYMSPSTCTYTTYTLHRNTHDACVVSYYSVQTDLSIQLVCCHVTWAIPLLLLAVLSVLQCFCFAKAFHTQCTRNQRNQPIRLPFHCQFQFQCFQPVQCPGPLG
ncbi:hypothetical protein DM02DRAFT_359985 [Periconia macrospinosa]|uniref:Uncharacterized protein n=1 Tax=Periconia macrospinosa TaxID=97972 RepID=A0A2V1DSS1_9PLEO|nr:hypothetical protein DM02DRAFT_359985 [Periconia macrospinosa]